MSQWNMGLRGKALAALLVACLIALVPAAFIGFQVAGQVQAYFGEAYARNLTELNRQRIRAPVLQDLMLARRLADSVLLREWLLDESDPEKRGRFFQEAGGYAEDFRSGAYFVASALSRRYYFNESDASFSEQPRYTLDPGSEDDEWFFNLVRTIGNHNINVNPDIQLETTRVWLNVPTRHQGEVIGLTGTGVDLTDFIGEFVRSDEPGVTPMIVDADGAIQAHPDPDRIAFGATAGAGEGRGSTLADILGGDQASTVVGNALEASRAGREGVALARADLNGEPHLLAVAYMPELDWHLVTAVNLGVARVMSGTWWVGIILGVLTMVVLLVVVIGIAVERILIRPLSHLQRSASQIADGNFEVSLPRRRRDEIGRLSDAFATMASTIQGHTRDLESKVRDRTRELEERNRDIALFNRMMNDSIEYASLIQQAILPDQSLERHLGKDHFVLWRPRDTVGGDFYFFHTEKDRHLLGLIDCAGHGVPGALMTMLARAAFDHAIRECGIDSPGIVLKRTDGILRDMLQNLDLPRALATNMDAALISLDSPGDTLRFAGARMSLYIHDGDQVDEVKGQRRALVGRKSGLYEDVELTLHPGHGYYMTTDGYLDQAGGDLGFGMGTTGFREALRAVSELPMAERGEALLARLEAYRGSYPQRDDVSVIGFRVQSHQEL